MSDQDSDLELKLDADKPTAIASNGRIDAVAFNMDHIAAKNPELAKEIRRAYEKANRISPDDGLDGHEEDIALASEMFNKRLPDDLLDR